MLIHTTHDRQQASYRQVGYNRGLPFAQVILNLYALLFNVNNTCQVQYLSGTIPVSYTTANHTSFCHAQWEKKINSRQVSGKWPLSSSTVLCTGTGILWFWPCFLHLQQRLLVGLWYHIYILDPLSPNVINQISRNPLAQGWRLCGATNPWYLPRKLRLKWFTKLSEGGSYLKNHTGAAIAVSLSSLTGFLPLNWSVSNCGRYRFVTDGDKLNI